MNRSSAEAVAEHLRRCSGDFLEPLSSRVDIDVYSKKLFEHALRIEYWDDSVLRGLVAAYIQDSDRSGFVTNASVEATFRRQGIASDLMETLIRTLRESGVQQLSLEVHQEAKDAIAFYSKHGFGMSSNSSCGSSVYLKRQV